MSETTDWPAVRARTPGAEAFIHLNHASTSLPDTAVFEAQQEFLELELQLGTHRAVDRMSSALDAVPKAVATLVSAQAHQVALLDSASHGFAYALSAAAQGRLVEVFVSKQEWAANLMCATVASGATLSVMQRDTEQSWASAVSNALALRDAQRVPIVSLPMAANTVPGQTT